MTLTDEQVLSLFYQDEQKGFKAIFEKYYPPLCLLASKYITDMGAAEDIVQNVFIGIWEGKKLRNVQTSVRSYLSTAVRNACIDQLEKSRKQSEMLQSGMSEAEWLQPDRISDILHFPEKMAQAINKLPEGCGKVLHLVYYEGLSYKKTASVLNISVNTVKTQLTRAIRSIKAACHSENLLT